MSMCIQITNIVEVLLADGWHRCDLVGKEQISTFNVDAYEFMDGKDLIMGGGVVVGIPSTGFWFEENGVVISGPLTSLLAVREWKRAIPDD